MEQGYWIRGNFDGDVTSLKPLFGSALTQRSSAANILRGRMTDISRLEDLPPSVLEDSQIYQRVVSTVHLQPGDGSNGWLSPVYDIYLQNIHFVTTGWDSHESSESIGRIVATAYARVLPARKQETPEPFSEDEAVDETSAKPSNKTNVEFQNNETDNVDAGKNVNTLRDPTPPLPATDLEEKPCEVCNMFWPLGVLVSGWLICSFKWALIMTLPFILRCVMAHIKPIPIRTELKNKIYSFGVLALVFSGTFWTLTILRLDCTSESYVALLLIASGLVLSSRLVHCWIPILAAILWIAASLASCSDGLGMCSDISLAGVTNSAKDKLQNIQDKIDSSTKKDDDAEVVSNSGEVLDGWKYVSLDAAIKNPDKVFSCPQTISGNKTNYAIYMGNRVLFETAKHVLTEDALPEMRILGELIKKYPEVQILIVGHTDNSPHHDGPIGNLLLSERRANTVTDWLVENGYISEDRITPLGVGERYPVFNVLNDQQPIASRANRRVDVRVQCNQFGKK